MRIGFAHAFDDYRPFVMMNPMVPPPAPYWRTFDAYLRERFGEKVRKIPIDAGFSCPHTQRGAGPCTFCDNAAFSPYAARRATAPVPVRTQIEEGIARAARRGVRKYIAYFQAYTNTNAPAAALRELYDEAFRHEGIVALAVGTRPDCAGDEVLRLLASYAERAEVWLELGLQSIHDPVLARLKRGHSYADFLDAVERARCFPLKLCAHVILGLPGLSREQDNMTANALAGLPVHGLKIHPLQILAGTALASEHARGEVACIDAEAYVARTVDFLERTRADVVIQRLGADAIAPALIAPRWSCDKQELLARIAAEFAARGTRQGARAASPPCIT